MSSTIIDETVILRYLLDDDEVLSPRAAKVIATRTARVYPEIITRVVVTLRDVYKVPRVEIAAAMKRLLDDVMVDEPTVVALAVKLFGKTHMDFTDCLLAARTAIYNDDVVSFGKPIIQGMIDYRRKRQTAADARDRAAEARSRSTDSTIDKLRHRPRSLTYPLLSCGGIVPGFRLIRAFQKLIHRNFQVGHPKPSALDRECPRSPRNGPIYYV